MLNKEKLVSAIMAQYQSSNAGNPERMRELGIFASHLAKELHRVEDTQKEVAHCNKLLETARTEYDSRIKQLQTSLKAVQDNCKHYIVEHNICYEDRSTECCICGKILR